MVFSASATCQKVGWAIGALFTGALLSGYGFMADKPQSPEVNHLLISLMSVIPAVFGVMSIILILFYKLDEKTMMGIAKDLIERRKASGDEALTV